MKSGLALLGMRNAEIIKGTEPKNNPNFFHHASRRREPDWSCYQSTLLENRNCTNDNVFLKNFANFGLKIVISYNSVSLIYL